MKRNCLIFVVLVGLMSCYVSAIIRYPQTWVFDKAAAAVPFVPNPSNEVISWHNFETTNATQTLDISAAPLHNASNQPTLATGPTRITFTNDAALVRHYYSFDGTDDRFAVDDESAYDFTFTTPFSVSTWAFFNVVTQQCFVCKAVNGAEGWELRMQNNGTLLWIFTRNNGQVLRILGGTPLTTGVWWHVAATYDGSSDTNGMFLYTNAAVLTDVTGFDDVLGGTFLNNEPVQFSGRGGAFVPMDGNLDDTIVWGTNITPANVTNAFTGTGQNEK